MRTAHVAGPPGPSPARRATEGPPPGDDGGFPAVLTETKARTAPAEGPKKTPEHDRPAHEPENDAAAAAVAPDAPETATVVATPDVDTHVPGTTVPEPAPVPGPESAHTIAGGGPAGVGTAGTGTGAGGVPTATAGMRAVVTGADDLPAGASVATTAPTTTTPAGAAAAITAVAVQGETADAAPPAAPIAPATSAGVPATSADAGAPAEGDAGAEGEGHAPATPAKPLPTGAPASPAAGSVLPAEDAHGPSVGGTPGATSTATTPATPAVPAAPAGAGAGTPATPATPAAPAVPTLPPATAEAWVSRGLAHTVERLADLAHVATARGVARARLQLHPQELGGIEVRLRQSADGLVATISAARGDGLEALQQTAGDLRRSLEERGITIARLDIELAARGDGQRPWQRDGHPAADAPGSTRSRDVRDPDGPDDEAIPTATAPTSTPAGVLVDVHA